MDSIGEDSENQSFINDTSCPICLNFLTTSQSTDDSITSEISNKYLQRLCERNSKNKIMVTACGHGFHPVCLLKWSEIRMECPSCRSPLNIQ